MEQKKLRITQIKNYLPTILEILNYTKGAPHRSNRFNLHRKLMQKYLYREEISFFKHNGIFKHFLGQNRTAKKRIHRHQTVFKRIYLYLNEDNTMGWTVSTLE